MVGIGRRAFQALVLLLGLSHWGGAFTSPALAEEQAPPPRPLHAAAPCPVGAVVAPALEPCDRPLPINLPTALHLANARAIDIALASERIHLAAAQLARAQVLWLPTVYAGTDYFRHDGQIQDVRGKLFGTSKQALMVGAGPYAVFALTDAIFGPLAQRQVVYARNADLQAATNDTLLRVAEAYFNVQQARGELAGTADAARRAEELVRRTRELAPALVPEVEAVRTRTELARRRQAVQTARERWKTASAELVRILRLEASAVVEPLEPPHLSVGLVPLDCPVDDLIPIGLTNRPELAAQQALVQAALQRLRQEKLRPLMPSVLLRGTSTNPGGTLAGGLFGGGINDRLADFIARSDFDIQVLWEFQNLGFGNCARVKERQSEQRIAVLELFRTQDLVAAEVVRAFAEAQAAVARMHDAQSGLRDAVESAEKNFEGLGQTRRAGNVVLLVIRPQEAVAAVQALALAYGDYYGSVADFNRAQFRLYRALGHPAQALAGADAWWARPARRLRVVPRAARGPGSRRPLPLPGTSFPRATPESAL